jgi:hypothetical protein
VLGRQLAASVSLIAATGGGWNASDASASANTTASAAASATANTSATVAAAQKTSGN